MNHPTLWTWFLQIPVPNYEIHPKVLSILDHKRNRKYELCTLPHKMISIMTSIMHSRTGKLTLSAGPWIHQLDTLRKKIGSPYDAKQSSNAALIFQIWGAWSYLFIAITTRSTLSTCRGAMYDLKRLCWKLLVLERNTWTVCKLCLIRIITWSYNCL